MVLSAANIQVIARAPRTGMVRQQACMALGNMEDDCPGLEQDKTAVLIGRDLSERMTDEMRGLLHRLERYKTDFIRLARFLKGPTAHGCRAPVPHLPGQSGERRSR